MLRCAYSNHSTVIPANLSPTSGLRVAARQRDTLYNMNCIQVQLFIQARTHSECGGTASPVRPARVLVVVEHVNLIIA